MIVYDLFDGNDCLFDVKVLSFLEMFDDLVLYKDSTFNIIWLFLYVKNVEAKPKIWRYVVVWYMDKMIGIYLLQGEY